MVINCTVIFWRKLRHKGVFMEKNDKIGTVIMGIFFLVAYFGYDMPFINAFSPLGIYIGVALLSQIPG